MPDGRPVELASYAESTVEQNDALIVGALSKLEDKKTRGKLKITVSSICKLTELSRNTVRNRPWALSRLKAIKQKLKNGNEEPGEECAEVEDEGTILDRLRKRIKRILEQNVLLYEEILSLRRIIEKKDAEIQQLKARKLEIV